MGETKDRKANLLRILRQQLQSPEADDGSLGESKRRVIELGDLTTGPESEIDRVKLRMIALSAEIGELRSENVRLASDYQKLTTELREIKLVLARAHAKELRAVEHRTS